MRAWVDGHLAEPRPPDHYEVDKGHGRIERREIWVTPAAELADYLEEEFEWPELRLCGQLRRYRRRLHQTEWASVRTIYWIAGGKLTEPMADQLQFHLRQHWVIENGVFYVRDVSYDEDRLHGRAIGFPLAALRNGAINLIRRAGFRYIPDARRVLSARPDGGLSLLFEAPP